MSSETRVPTSEKSGGIVAGWSLETAIDYLLAVVNERDVGIRELINGNDRRYSERFTAIQHTIEVGLSSQKAEIGLALTSSDRAVLKAETAAEKRFESVNEFRNTLADQQRNLMPRAEVNVMMGALESKVDALVKQIEHLQAERMGIKGGWGYAAGVIGLVIALFAIAASVAGWWASVRNIP